MRTCSRPRKGTSALLAAALAAGLAAGASSQEAPPASEENAAFVAQVEQVTVDAVVLDKKGQPVGGLTKSDFEILDEGQPRQIVSFDVVGPARAPASSASRPPTQPVRPVVGTNRMGPGDRGRLFVIVFDDVHMSPLNARRAKAAVVSFLEKGVQEGDRVLLVATTGSAWWSTRMESGRPDLLAVLKHLDGRWIKDSAFERLTDYEAVRITVYHDALVAQRVQDRLERYGSSSRQDMKTSQDRMKDSGLVPGAIDPYIELRAQEAYVKLRSRLEITSGILRRCFRALEGSHDRKAVLLVSEGFVYDPSLDIYRRTTEAARRANAALYFIDTRGLETLGSAYSAEFGAAMDERDRLAAIADVSFEGEGAANLASDTGGFSVRNTNDFAEGATEIGRESRSYYLIGYNPGEIPHNGRFRKIELRVRSKSLTVRARKGYYAPGPPTTGAAPAAVARGESREPELQRALDSPGFLDAVPLRMTAYALESTGRDTAAVNLAAEADVSKLVFASGEGNAVLDTLVVIASRDTGEQERRDMKVELRRLPGAPPAGQAIWYSFIRPFQLKAGSYQAKLLVRDASTGHLGSLIYEFDVPPLDQLRVSTPILSDVLSQAPGGSGSPVLVVGRAFPSGATLYCRFDVYGAGSGPDGKPLVKAGHSLRTKAGVLVGQQTPTPIEATSIGALARLVQIPLAGIPPGDYELLLTVKDEITGQSREIAEPFTVTPPKSASAS